MSKRRAFSPWSPTTDPLPPPAKFTPRLQKLPPDWRLPMAEAPTVPGRYIVKLLGAYGLSVMDYTGPYAIAEMEDDHRSGVAFFERISE